MSDEKKTLEDVIEWSEQDINAVSKMIRATIQLNRTHLINNQEEDNEDPIRDDMVMDMRHKFAQMAIDDPVVHGQVKEAILLELCNDHKISIHQLNQFLLKIDMIPYKP